MPSKAAIVEELKKLGVEHDPNASMSDLSALLKKHQDADGGDEGDDEEDADDQEDDEDGEDQGAAPAKPAKPVEPAAKPVVAKPSKKGRVMNTSVKHDGVLYPKDSVVEDPDVIKEFEKQGWLV